ncbi:MAG: DUF4942 domain-containing protein [Devosia sp.]|uniref:DUF4942 domain-containing protein n=1 Tax=Devosia sp. TaxID=1871048 RepID=UPI001AD4E432|nr:DUF4942 domain-containing protein [Devosia sp.]MBN9314201.1 DUF4942 domain-containing protein [Devosia sp.]
MNAIMPRATIEQIVGFRNAALDLYSIAYDRLLDAEEAVAAAKVMAGNASPGINGFNYGHEGEIKRFDEAIKLPNRDEYLRTARKLMDINVWAYIIERTDLERLMDAEAKKTLRSQMAYVPDRVDRRGQLITDEEAAKGLPEITVENVQATIQQFMLDADMIFRRGLANVFSHLDRRFRSHDGFKVGSRMIVNRVCDADNGRFSWGSKRDELLDVERVFYVLEGEPLPSTGTIVNLIELDRSKNWSPMQSEIESRFMKIRIFKNGNAHLWFTNKELVEKVNKILADYYGEVIGDGNTTEADPFAEVKHLPARYFGFFPTPDDAADRVFDGRGSRSFNNGIIVFQPKDKPRLRILEPSAGTGNLARRCVTVPARAGRYASEYRYDNLVDCVEIQPHLAAELEAEGHYNRVLCMDFLQLNPESTSPYDLVVMNPPFDRERDIDHVMHAVKFLKPGGRLTAIMSAGTEFRETRKATAFREFVASHGGEFVDLPAGSFSEVGTNVNTLYVTFRTKA